MKACMRANLNLVRELMGHASILTTQRYLHSQSDEKRQAIESLAASSPKACQLNVKDLENEGVTPSLSVS